MKFQKILFVCFFLITSSYLMYELFFSNKSLVVFFNNITNIKNKKMSLNQQKEELEKLKIRFDEFKKNSDYRKLIIKEKLYFKEEDDLIIRYDFKK